MAITDPRRFHRPDRQGYAVAQAQDRHTEVLYRRGEYSFFILMWDVRDFENGLVDRCPACVDRFGTDAAFAFGNQVATERCTSCFGGGFEGGYKAKIVRPSLWDLGLEAEEIEVKEGTFQQESAAITSTFDFKLNRGDYVIRNNGTRWYARAPRKGALTTGFGGVDALGFNYTTITMEPLASPVYLIDPTEMADVTSILTPSGHSPDDFSAYEEIKAGATLL